MKRILTTLAQKWPEYLLEILVITIGIYGAFALDSWNQNVASISKEKILLSSVNDEFKSNKAQFEKIIVAHKKCLKSIVWMQENMPFSNANNQDSIAIHFRGTFIAMTFNPSSSSIDAIVNTGSLNIIRNVELRNLLVKWNDALLDYQEEEVLAMEYFWGEYFATWRTLIDFEFFETLDFKFVDYEALNSRIAKNLIYQRSFHYMSIFNDGELEEIEGMLNRIIELTESEN